MNKPVIGYHPNLPVPGPLDSAGRKVQSAATRTYPATPNAPSPGHILSSAKRSNLGFFKISMQEKLNAPFFLALDKWAALGERGEHRNEAAKRYKEWVNRGDRERALNVVDLGLKSLPEMPPGVRYFYAGGNKLTHLPALPAGLVSLSVPNNELESLPDLLPASVTDLNAFGNKLSTLPHNITDLKIYHSLVNVLSNPLTDDVRQTLQAVTEANPNLPILFDRTP